MSRIASETMLRIREAILQELPGEGSSLHRNDLFDAIKRKLKMNGVMKDGLSKDRFSTAIKYLRDSKQLASIRMRNNQVSYYKTGNVFKRASHHARDSARTCDLILPDRKMSPMEFSCHILSQSQFSGGRVEVL